MEKVDLMQTLRERRAQAIESAPPPLKDVKERDTEKEKREKPKEKAKKTMNFGDKLSQTASSYAPYRNTKERTRMSVTLSGENKDFLYRLALARKAPINQTLNEILDEYRNLYEEAAKDVLKTKDDTV